MKGEMPDAAETTEFCIYFAQVGIPGGGVLHHHAPESVLQALVHSLFLAIGLWVIARGGTYHCPEGHTEGPPHP